MFDMIINSALWIILYMTIFYLFAIIRKDNSIVDYAWGMGFVLVAALGLVQGNLNIINSANSANNTSIAINSRQMLMFGMTALWGLRLSIYIFFRNKGKGEDFRYAQWRNSWGKFFYIRSFFQVFMLQGLLLLIISMPILLVNHSTRQGLGLVDLIGLLIWLIGMLFEGISDYQMQVFKKDKGNKGEIIKTGLWKYSRHPNYFGEVLIWWGIFFVGLQAEFGIFGVIGPLLITFLLLKVSGIPMLEKKYENNPAYQKYKKVTNSFFPGLPKKEKEMI